MNPQIILARVNNSVIILLCVTNIIAPGLSVRSTKVLGVVH